MLENAVKYSTDGETSLNVEIRDKVQDRYPETGEDLLRRLLKDPVQMDLLGLANKPSA